MLMDLEALTITGSALVQEMTKIAVAITLFLLMTYLFKIQSNGMAQECEME